MFHASLKISVCCCGFLLPINLPRLKFKFKPGNFHSNPLEGDQKLKVGNHHKILLWLNNGKLKI